MERVGEDTTTFGHRDAKYAFVIQSRWQNPRYSAVHLAWTQEFFEAMKAHCDGTVYANFIADEGEMRVAGAYNVAAFQRFRKIKSRYDPKNLFRMNQNIRPA
jgi:FAD/FMN-containing dehydrogenase